MLRAKPTPRQEFCGAPDCGRPWRAGGWCQTHYRRMKDTGELGPPIKTKAPNGEWSHGSFGYEKGCRCHVCEASQHRRTQSRYQRLFGISFTEYQQIVMSQCGVCGICGEADRTGKRLAVDHDHDTGRVRGLLCYDCNTSLGKFGDSPGMLARALEWVS